MKNPPDKLAIQLPLPLRFLSLVECSDQSGKVPDTHHLRQKCETHPWQLRVTICQGPKFVGRRVIVPLGTHDLEEAAKLRDLLLDALGKGGFVAGVDEMKQVG